MTVACAAFRRSELTAGHSQTCGIVKADAVRCWGYNVNGETIVPAVSGGWASLIAGGHHTCGVLKADDSTRCWGWSNHGQTVTNVPKP